METLLTEPFLTGIILFLGFICMALEVFIPSGGILGLLAVGFTAFGVYGLFYQDHPLIAVLVICSFAAVFIAMFRYMVRRLSFSGSLPPETSTSVDRRIAGLVGREGVAVTPLHPAGMALIDGCKIDVVTLGDYIEKDAPIRVVDNSGNRVVVRQVESRRPS